MMAYDYGTYTMTVTAPGGKPGTGTGAYLNVWRKVGGEWKLVAEMSTPIAAPK
jgi:ketosteroid isomerase-like protein